MTLCLLKNFEYMGIRESIEFANPYGNRQTIVSNFLATSNYEL